jgi:hypothetical protein
MTYNIQDVKQTNDMQTTVRCNHAQSTIYQFLFFFYFLNLLIFYLKIFYNKMTNKQIDRVFFHTPKLESHIVHNVQYINTLSGVRKHQSVKKVRAPPKLKHEFTCHKLTTIFLTEIDITRSIAVRNKRKRPQ